MLSIRPAQSSDARRIAEIQRSSWAATYPNKVIGLSVEMIEMRFDNLERTFDSRVQKWADTIIHLSSSDNLMVAIIDQNIIGFCSSHKDGLNGKVRTIYIDPKFTKQGGGGILIKSALEWLNDCPRKIVELAAYNQNAIDFYKHYGFELNGVACKSIEVESAIIPVVQMEKFDLPLIKFKMLETQRLILRMPTLDDLDSIMAYAGDPEATKYLSIDTQTRDSSGNWLAKYMLLDSTPSRKLCWMIIEKDSGNCMGAIDFGYNLTENPFIGSIGYALAPQYWGKGYMTEAAQAIVNFAFTCEGFTDSVYIPVYEPNSVSAKVALKLGFTSYGPMKNTHFSKGRFFDSYLLILTKEEWLATN